MSLWSKMARTFRRISPRVRRSTLRAGCSGEFLTWKTRPFAGTRSPAGRKTFLCSEVPTAGGRKDRRRCDLGPH